MKKGMLFLILFLLVAQSSLASTVSFLFWYPGEAGSAAEAAPLFDHFCRAISVKIPGQSCRATYSNSDSQGIALLRQAKADIVIVSHPAWIEHRQLFSAHPIWLLTLPVPGGTTAESYALMGTEKQLPADAKIYTSPSLDANYVRHSLFRELPPASAIIPTPALFEKLRSIGSAKERAFAILSPAEKITLESLKTSWASSIIKLQQSAEVPSPYVMLHNPKLPQQSEIKNILLGMKDDPALHELLMELRLKGFAFPAQSKLPLPQ